jgi:thiol-activated cytolysin
MLDSCKKLLILITIIMVLGLGFSGCKDGESVPVKLTADETSDETGDGNSAKNSWNANEVDEISKIIASGWEYQPRDDSEETELIGEPEIKGDYKLTKEKHNVIKNKESVLFLGMNDDVLFPGALIQGKEVDDFVFRPIIVDRNPINLSLSVEGSRSTGNAINITVDDPSELSNVRQGINDLLKSAFTEETRAPAKLNYDYKQVFSRQDLSLALGVSASYAGASFDFDFDWNDQEQRTKIVSTYQQTYYTVDMDMPQNAADFFHPSIGIDGVARVVPPGSIPMYVSSVSYGWMAVLFIETQASAKEMKAALNAAYSGWGAEFEADVKTRYQDILESSEINILVYGGSTAGITSNTLQGIDGLNTIISASKEFNADSPGVPLYYKLRYLDNNLVAKIALTEEYTILKAQKIREYIKIKFYGLECNGCLDNGDSNKELELEFIQFLVMLYQGPTEILLQDIFDFDQRENPNASHVIGGISNLKWYPAGPHQTVVCLNLEELNLDVYSLYLMIGLLEYDKNSSDDYLEGVLYINGKDLINPFEQQEIKFFEVGDNGRTGLNFKVYYSIEPSSEAEYNLSEVEYKNGYQP